METEEFEITFSSPCDLDCAAKITYPEIVHFAGGIFQTIWGLFLGDIDSEKLNEFDRTQCFDYQADQLDIEIALEMVASSYWLVTARNDAVLRRIEEHFKEVFQ